MTEPERLHALKGCLEDYGRSREKVNDQLPGSSGPDKAALLKHQEVLTRKIEQTEIEIGFIENVKGLIEYYTQRQQEAYNNAQAESNSVRRKAFEDRASFCEVVINEALEKKQEVKPIPQESLNRILADLSEAAQEAKDTVDSINNAITLVNRALDGLILLVKVAAKVAI